MQDKVKQLETAAARPAAAGNPSPAEAGESQEFSGEKLPQMDTCRCHCEACRSCDWKVCACGTRIRSGDADQCLACEAEDLASFRKREVRA